jgi:nucleotide-binding universal stress UspA family protein
MLRLLKGGSMGTIVCAVDGSPEAEEALRVAARLSRRCGLRLVLAHVQEGLVDRPSVRAAAQDRGRNLLSRLVASQELNGAADRRVEVGARGQEIARIAAEEAASLIIAGSRHRHRWQRARGQGLVHELAETAPCPVVVAPPSPQR